MHYLVIGHIMYTKSLQWYSTRNSINWQELWKNSI